MKRSPLPARKRPLARAALAKAAVVRVRTAGLPRVGRRGRVSAAGLNPAREAVKARSGGRCECWLAFTLNGPAQMGDRDVRLPAGGFVDTLLCETLAEHAGEHAHHVWPEDRDRGVHDPARIVWICAASHARIHANPNTARALGFLRAQPRIYPTDRKRDSDG